MDHPGKQKSHDEAGSAEPQHPESSARLIHPNGTEIFPSMSVVEQTTISNEAIAQAEAHIVADNDVVDADEIGDGATDGGYESDSFNETTSSVSSSVRDYMFENGRRYHRFREGSYNFPNDDPEQEREDMKHAMMKLLCNQKLHFAPIGDNPQMILDMGTGTGIWAIEMGDLYSSASVIGVDLSPIQPDWLPPNVQFVVDDVEAPWLYPRDHFDYIHARHTVMAIKNWMKLFRRAFEHLKPGGWIELQEIHHSPLTTKDDGEVPLDHPVAQFWARINEGLTALGIDFHAAADSKLADSMRTAGLVNVTERTFHVPIGTWPKNKVLKTVGLYWRTILLDGLQAIALGPLTRGLKWSIEDVETFLMDVRRAYMDNSALMYMRLRLIYGQKPI
ncbi:S-adenosyl-L-methionine-dependent methyltransferase [Stachybotrys elegans]|uniref:S-adenosyl-L-methionine-dependent methyltransferase n=1 Tax=Stachybotrys elegans TaxID=80388 RepID=A0A8K0WQT7_9HYPO|nr:S-adenosyl-L-methionine-dependent methyltransferase [Stachybotrys elegans]